MLKKFQFKLKTISDLDWRTCGTIATASFTAITLLLIVLNYIYPNLITFYIPLLNLCTLSLMAIIAQIFLTSQHDPAGTKKKIKVKANLKQYVLLIVVSGALFLYPYLSIFNQQFFDKHFDNSQISLDIYRPNDNQSDVYFEKKLFGTITEDKLLPVTSNSISNIIFNASKISTENPRIEITGRNYGTDVYINDQLLLPDITRYQKIKDFNDAEIWVKKNFNYKIFADEDQNVDRYVFTNFRNANIYYFKDFSESSYEIGDYQQTTTTLESTFRGDLKLATYVDGALNLTFIKQDLNLTYGKDTYTVTITDYAGKVWFEQTYEDDGEFKINSNSNPEIEFSIHTTLPKNIYFIKFSIDQNNKALDGTIKRIQINSNKLLIVGNFLVWDPRDAFYTRAEIAKRIQFYYWWPDKFQKIVFSGAENKTIDLNADWLNEKFTEYLNVLGEYVYTIEKGYVWVYTDLTSVNKQSWFTLPSKNKPVSNDPDVFVIDSHYLNINGNLMTANAELSNIQSNSLSFQAINANSFELQSLKIKQ